MRKMLFLLAGIALLGVGCSDDDSGGSEETSAAGSAADGGGTPVQLQGEVNNEGTGDVSGDEFALELDDYYFGPTFIKAQPGATIHLELENEGDDAHTFTSDALGVDQEVQPGENATVDVTLPQQGAVQFYCRFHQDRGMQGAFFFNEGDTLTTGAAGATETTGG